MVSHRIFRGARVGLDGVVVEPDADDVVIVWAGADAGFVSYRGPETSALRRALAAAPGRVTLAIAGLRVALAPVGPRGCTPGETLCFRVEDVGG